MLFDGRIKSMTAFIISLMFGVGVGTFVWAQLARGTGNADPKTVFGSAGIVGFIAFLFFYATLKWVLHIG